MIISASYIIMYVHTHAPCSKGSLGSLTLEPSDTKCSTTVIKDEAYYVAKGMWVFWSNQFVELHR